MHNTIPTETKIFPPAILSLFIPWITPPVANANAIKKTPNDNATSAFPARDKARKHIAILIMLINKGIKGFRRV